MTKICTKRDVHSSVEEGVDLILLKRHYDVLGGIRRTHSVEWWSTKCWRQSWRTLLNCKRMQHLREPLVSVFPGRAVPLNKAQL